MDPISIGFMGLSALGSLFGGATQSASAQAAAERAQAEGAAKSQADLYNAQQATQEAAVNTQITLAQGQAAAATAAVQAAANGGGFTGSTLGVLQQLSSKALFDARAVAYRGRTQAQADTYQSQIDTYDGQVQAAQDNAQASNAMISGVIGAASDVFGGIAKSNAMSGIANAFKAVPGAGFSAVPALTGAGDLPNDFA